MGFQLPPWLTGNSSVVEAIHSAELAGKAVITSAQSYAVTLIGHIETNFENKLPVAEDLIVKTLVDFVPSGPYRDDVHMFLVAAEQNTIKTLNPALIANVKVILGTALARINGALGAAGAAIP